MRTVFIGAILTAALTFVAPASAGCWATVDLDPPPKGIAAGDVWTAELTVLQHGRNPLPDAADATPTVTIVNGESGERRAFKAPASDPAAGRYEAEVVFPSGGAWSYEVFDGFNTWNGEPAPCAQTHTFASVHVGGPRAAAGEGSAPTASGFSIWPPAGAVGVLLIGGIALVYLLRRHGSRARGAA
jgi:hypothetical protein